MMDAQPGGNAAPGRASETIPPIPERRLDLYCNTSFHTGDSAFKQLLWYVASAFIFETKIFPFSSFKCGLLRWFGARVGRGVVVKPGVRIKFPWRLTIHDHVWIGESAWIDNLAEVALESHVCLSQGVYLCTGSHDAGKATFDLITKPITVQRGAWLAARSTILPGVTIGSQSVVCAGAVVTRSVESRTMVAGVPAQPLGGSPRCRHI